MKRVSIVVAGVGLVILMICGIMTLVSADGEDDPGPATSHTPTPAPQKTAVAKASTRPDTIREGVWSVGEDIKPGRYRTMDILPEGAQCYWQVSTDPEGKDIVANDIPTGGRPTVTLKKGEWFKTQGCGNWIKQ